VDFGAEDEGRLMPFKNDKLKDTENPTFKATSVLVVKAIRIWGDFYMFLKRFAALMVVFLLTFTSAYAEGEITLSGKSALLMDSATGTILYENNAHEKLPMASVTKIMTMLLTMEAIDSGKITYDEMVTGSAYAKSMGGSTIFLDEGEQLSVSDILKGIAVASGNDASVAIAEHIAGSVPAFVEMMNKRATELGMTNTNFVNCNGLDADGHYTTAYDIALMSRELLKHPDIHKYTTIWMDSLRNGEFTLSNTNKLVRFYEGCTGLKTGSTDKALFCMSATAKREGLHLIAVIMAAPTSKQRQADASSLLNYGFANFASKSIIKNGDIAKEIKVEKGVKDSCNLICKDDITALCKKGEDKNIKKEYIISKSVKAPVKQGEKAGELVCYDGETEIGRCDLLYNEDIRKMTVAYSYGSIIDVWLGKK